MHQLKVIQDNNLEQQYSSVTFSEGKADWFGSTMWQTYSQNNLSCSLPYKAIVFSQFLEHINVIEQQVGHPEDLIPLVNFVLPNCDADTHLLLRKPRIVDRSLKNVHFPP